MSLVAIDSAFCSAGVAMESTVCSTEVAMDSAVCSAGVVLESVVSSAVVATDSVLSFDAVAMEKEEPFSSDLGLWVPLDVLLLDFCIVRVSSLMSDSSTL